MWYAVELKSKAKFEEVMSAFPLLREAAASCPAFLRHKTAMVSPYLLAEKGIRIVK